MISFDFANGDPFCPHVPASIDDDDYVEYPLDNLADFPSNVEEEERVSRLFCAPFPVLSHLELLMHLIFHLPKSFQMFMEAVLESLKDMEMGNSSVEEPSSNVDNGLPERSQKDGQEDSSTATKYGTPEMEPATILAANDHDSAPQDPLPAPSKSSVETPSSTVSSLKGAGKDRLSPLNDTTDSNRSPINNDAVDHTKATVTVVKTPTSNIMDGLLRRWDLNFFRNR
jgi:hypothetical protein